MAEPSDDGPVSSLLGIELFAGVDKKPKIVRSVREHTRFEHRPQGHHFVRQGEYTESFYIVLRGGVTAYRTGSDGVTRQLDALGSGDWFGELSTLSNQPSPATFSSDTPCLLAVLDADTFKELYRGVPGFKSTIDDRYRDRSLTVHLRVAPLFAAASDALLERIKRHASFETFDEGACIASEGQRASALYLIRSGAVSLEARRSGGGRRVKKYYMNNSSFGECCLLDDEELRTWQGDHVALTRTEVVVVPGEVIRSALSEDQEARARLLERALALVGEDEPADALTTTGTLRSLAPRLPDDEVEVMVQGQSVKGGEALVIDLMRCTRCNACVESCVAVHEDRIPRLSKKGTRLSDERVLTTSCYNCEIPECMMSCMFGAIRRDAQGLIRFVYQNCTGCSMCVEHCPYDVIRLTPPPRESTPKRSASLWASWFGFGSERAEPAEPAGGEVLKAERTGVQPKAKAVKCDLCAGLPFEACVYNCPCSAIQRVPVAELWNR